MATKGIIFLVSFVLFYTVTATNEFDFQLRHHGNHSVFDDKKVIDYLNDIGRIIDLLDVKFEDDSKEPISFIRRAIESIERKLVLITAVCNLNGNNTNEEISTAIRVTLYRAAFKMNQTFDSIGHVPAPIEFTDDNMRLIEACLFISDTGPMVENISIVKFPKTKNDIFDWTPHHRYKFTVKFKSPPTFLKIYDLKLKDIIVSVCARGAKNPYIIDVELDTPHELMPDIIKSFVKVDNYKKLERNLEIIDMISQLQKKNLSSSENRLVYTIVPILVGIVLSYLILEDYSTKQLFQQPLIGKVKHLPIFFDKIKYSNINHKYGMKVINYGENNVHLYINLQRSMKENQALKVLAELRRLKCNDVIIHISNCGFLGSLIHHTLLTTLMEEYHTHRLKFRVTDDLPDKMI